MIERKDVKHEIRSQEHIHCDEVCSVLFVSFSQFVDEFVQRRTNHPVIEDSKRHNEEAIRLKLYGDIVDKLTQIRQSLKFLTTYDLHKELQKLIDKLEWRE